MKFIHPRRFHEFSWMDCHSIRMASNPHHKNGYKKLKICTQNLPICFQT